MFLILLNQPYLISAKCGKPTLTDGQISVSGFMEPAVEDSVVTFGCPGELVLNGFKTSTCIRGEWEPDPRNLQCSGEKS